MYKPNRKLIDFSDIMLDKIQALKEATGANTLSEVVRTSIEKQYRSYFPSYKNIQDPEIKAKAKVKTKELEENVRLAPKMRICTDILGGEVIKNDNGDYLCQFTQYDLSGADDELTLPLVQVDPIIAETSLFTPSREAIFKARKDIKKKFELLLK